MDVVRGGAGVGAGLTGAGVDVAMIDSGVVGFPALASGGRLLRGPDFSTDAVDPDLRDLDTFGHGTHLAGLITGDDPVSGFQGVAPGARLVERQGGERRRAHEPHAHPLRLRVGPPPSVRR